MRTTALLLLPLALACTAEPQSPDRSGPLSFEVAFEGAPGGLDAADPVPFTNDPIEYDLVITAIGHDRQPLDHAGRLTLRATPGRLFSDPFVDMEGGEARVTVEVAQAYGPMRIWAADEGTSAEPGSFATGVTPAIHFDKPTVRQVQESDSVVESDFEHQYVPFKGFDGSPGARELLVTSVTNDGFYVTDMTEGVGNYSSLFVFSFSRPEGVQPGDVLESLDGIVAEFLGFTELSFPTWRVADTPRLPLPEPFVLSPDMVCDSPEMEKYESAVVKVENLVSDFASGGDCLDYAEFGQWPALLEGSCGGGDARVNVVNANTVPSFGFPPCSLDDPPTSEHRVQLDWLVGILRHNRYASPAWILEVRSCLDFPEEHRPDDCRELLRSPRSGPRMAPTPYYREAPSCLGEQFPGH